MFPPFWMKWLAKVCRRAWAAWPFGRRIVVLARAPGGQTVQRDYLDVRVITAAPALFQQLGDLFGGQPGQLPFLHLERLHLSARVDLSVPGNAPTQVR